MHPMDVGIGKVEICAGFRCVSKWNLPVVAMKYKPKIPSLPENIYITL